MQVAANQAITQQGVPTHSAYLERRHFNGLDGIRFLAILAVIWHHAVDNTTLPLFGRGFFGVDLFFVLSGFLISTLLIREKARTGSISLKNFWMRRVLRLVPVYYSMLAVLALGMFAFKPVAPATIALLHGLPVYALYLSNWFDPGVAILSPMWSLATEEQFYVVWPFIETFATPLIGAVTWVIALIVNQLINFGLLNGAIQTWTGVSPANHPNILQVTFTPILLGVGLAHTLNAPRGYEIAKSLAGVPNAAAIYAVTLIALLALPIADISGLPRLYCHVTATLMLAAIVLDPDSITTRILDSKPFAFIGQISYGMYIYHMFALHGARVIAEKLHLPEFPAVFLIGLAITVAASAASFHLFEKQFLALRSKFRPPVSKP